MKEPRYSPWWLNSDYVYCWHSCSHSQLFPRFQFLWFPGSYQSDDRAARSANQHIVAQEVYGLYSSDFSEILLFSAVRCGFGSGDSRCFSTSSSMCFLSAELLDSRGSFDNLASTLGSHWASISQLSTTPWNSSLVSFRSSLNKPAWIDLSCSRPGMAV